MNAALKNVTVLPGGLCSLEDEHIKHIVKRITVDDAAGKRGGAIGMSWAGGFPGHFRVREAAAEERKGLASLFPEQDRSRWVEQMLQTDRSRVPVVERFENGKWVPIGLAIVDATGQMAFGLLPRYRGLGFSSSAIRAALQYLSEYTLTVLTARIRETEPSATRAFERAGFVFSGQFGSAGRIEHLYDFVIRSECTHFNVWI
jgi:RimJ/RimL family protein N-acetyltransferase